jgi:two-component system chemotaxis sensor kinase CheA
LETPSARLQQGKPERGTLTITAAQQSSNSLVVTVADDGAGIHLARVAQAALRAGCCSRPKKPWMPQPSARRKSLA